MKRITLILVLALIVLSVFKAASQPVKLNKIELGCHATYFFDERGFQFDYIFPPFPFCIFNSLAYSRTFKKGFPFEFQFRIINFESKGRMKEYDLKSIKYKSFFESYSYFSLNLMTPIIHKKYFKSYIYTGLVFRDGGEGFYTYFSTWEAHTANRFCNDLGLSLGFRIESKTFHNFYLYFQPQYNFYVYRFDKNFLQNELIGNAGIGYNFNFKKKK